MLALVGCRLLWVPFELHLLHPSVYNVHSSPAPVHLVASTVQVGIKASLVNAGEFVAESADGPDAAVHADIHHAASKDHSFQTLHGRAPADVDGVLTMAQEKPFETLLLERVSSVAVLTLNRPEVLNAYNPKMGRELSAALRMLADDETRAVILTGAGRAFCAGADISRPKDRASQWDPNIVRAYESEVAMLRLMVNYPKPVIAAIDGIALGVGFSLILPCDIRLASEKARFGATFTRIGMVPELGSTFLLPRLVGFGNAMELLMTARTIEADEACRLGLINRVTPEGKVLEEALETAGMIVKSPPLALQLTKQALHRAAASGIMQATEFEGLAMQMCRGTSDHKEAIRAFREKREPRFTGN